MGEWTGKTFAGFEVGERLGAGGMGVVYRARHAQTGADVALKILQGVDAEARLRFQREGEAQASVDDHPNVVRVHSAGVVEGVPYLVMDLASGGSLAARLQRGRLPIAEAVSVAAQLARGLAYVHARGVVHRDLKPENVLFDESGVPRVGDFGLARIAGAQPLTQTGAFLGTPAYAAPEQVSGSRAIGPAADVYALGAVLYAMLTGEPPFRAGSALATLDAVLHERAAPPSRRRPEVDRALDALCARCLRKAPEDRPASAEVLQRELERWRPRAPTRSRLPIAIAVAIGACAVALAWGLARSPSTDSQRPLARPLAPPPVAESPPRRPDAQPVTPSRRNPLDLGPGPVAEVRHESGPESFPRMVFLSADRFVSVGDDHRLKWHDLSRLGTPDFLENEIAVPWTEGPNRGRVCGLVADEESVVVAHFGTDLCWLREGKWTVRELPIHSLAVSRSQGLLAAGSANAILLFDLQSGALRETVALEAKQVVDLAFAGGTRLAVLGNERSGEELHGDQLLFVDLRSRRVLQKVPLLTSGKVLSVRPGAETFALGTVVGTIELRRIADGQWVGLLEKPDVDPGMEILGRRAHAGSLRAMAYVHRAGGALVSLGRGDRHEHNELAIWHDGQLVGHAILSHEPNAVAIAPDDRTVLVSTRVGVVQVWRAR